MRKPDSSVKNKALCGLLKEQGGENGREIRGGDQWRERQLQREGSGVSLEGWQRKTGLETSSRCLTFRADQQDLSLVS